MAGSMAFSENIRSKRSKDHINRQLGQLTCEVYFFESWSGYGHPIKPEGPHMYEEAITMPQYYRAWLTNFGTERRLVLFEGIKQIMEPYSDSILEGNPNVLSFWHAVQTDSGFRIGEKMTIEDVFDAQNYFRFPGSEFAGGKALLVRSIVRLRYRYHYHANGNLLRVEITNADGKVSSIDY